MIKRIVHNNVTWLDVLNPTADEIREIFEETSMPTEFTNDLTAPTPQTRTVLFKNAVKITLDFPIVKRTDISHPHEIKFIATKSHLVTIRFEVIESIHSFSKKFEVDGILHTTKQKKKTGCHVLFSLLTHIYGSMDSKLDYLETQMQNIEADVFKDNERKMLVDMSAVSRRLILFRQTLDAHDHALQELETGITAAFGKQHLPSVAHVQHLYRYLTRRASMFTVTLDDLRDTNNALLTTKQNEVMKNLTIMAFITFPLTLFTSLFGMNTTTTPLVGRANDFWYILGAMFIASVGFFMYFKYKKWM